MWSAILMLLLTMTPTAASAQATSMALATETGFAAATALLYPRDTYAGRDPEGVPYYVDRPFTLEELISYSFAAGSSFPGEDHVSMEVEAGASLNLKECSSRDHGNTAGHRSHRHDHLRKPKELGRWHDTYHLAPDEFWQALGGKIVTFHWKLD